jgi:hypothetical protein
MSTPSVALPLIAPGAQVVVRDEEWLVRAVQQTTADGKLVRVIGASELVRDQEATFLTELDDVQPLRPEDTTLILALPLLPWVMRAVSVVAGTGRRR